ncbi:MAG: type II toxin-antitoxin system HicA family toxin [Methylobacter sp.]
MGQLGGFCYREIVKRLKQLGFQFDRQAAGSHEIWYNTSTSRYTTIPNHPGGHFACYFEAGGYFRYRVFIPINGQSCRPE